MKTKPTRKRNNAGAKNASKKRGQMLAFTPKQIETLAIFLRESERVRAKRDYALMWMAVDTILRSVDLLQLTYGQTMRDGEPVEEFQIQQQKTGELVRCVLTEPSREALARYVGSMAPHIWEDGTRRLFPITTRQYQNLVNRWCEMLRLDKTRYSTHSFRRTKVRQIYAETGNMAFCQKLLGHSSILHTQRYLGVTQEDALDWARKVVFK
jgi:integrase